MALVRWQPRELFSLRRDFDRLFEDLWSNDEGATNGRETTWRPSVDIRETDQEFLIHADLPGIRQEDLEITVTDGRLTIKGQRHQEKESKEGGLHRVERAYGTFTRTFDLPAAVDTGAVAAAYRDGVLTVTVPKAEEAKPKQIEVKVSA